MIDADDTEAVDRGFDIVEFLEQDQSDSGLPLNVGPLALGDLIHEYQKLDFDDLLNPFKIDYIHFLHSIVMTGILPARQRGSFRRTHVHVGTDQIVFPPPSAVAACMKEFYDSFPTILPGVTKYDPVIKAAEVSHQFVRIHPYLYGNGRVSRLLMNLVLWQQYFPTYLKADKKGRHRYNQALKRANHGNIEPLAALIALQLCEVYDRLFDSIGRV